MLAVKVDIAWECVQELWTSQGFLGESSVLVCLDIGALDRSPLSHLSLIITTKNSFHLFGRDIVTINCLMTLKNVEDKI